MTDADRPAAPDDLDVILGALGALRGRGPGGARGGPHRHGHHGPHRRGGVPGHERGHDHDHGRGEGPEPDGMRGARIGGPARLRLLEALAAASVPLSVSEAADVIGVDQPRASRLVQQAVEMGLVRREADPADARRTRIALTDQGAGLVRGFRGRRRDQLATALEGFTAPERAELARLLARLADAWPRE
ncbi:MarR family winged helix-turn-helix transcriptional regulator [Microbacterium sp. No. 7]|uniref:MarR family winged helix-turn-helix transcriptional regulator n=1 Tax=Microbacterium sp. No. 7 TaxID=1714373 RepID=UPI0018D1743E|nr:MarR family winged helix-turn-helix transcriptional regulator [Microbacterium sp. No. 7]